MSDIMSLAIIQQISEKIDTYSPIVLEGSAEINKSQIVEELCEGLCQKGRIKEYKIRYSWDVLDGLIMALCENNKILWKQELLSSEIIIIDDFHYLKEKTAIAEELYKIFKTANVPIIITTSIPITNENFYCEDLVAFLRKGTFVNLNKEIQ